MVKSNAVVDNAIGAKNQINISNPSKGYGTIYAAFYILIRTIGIGVFVLPKVMGLVGWAGYFILFFANAWGIYGATQLSTSWDIVKARYPEIALKTCSIPYVEVGYLSFGITGKYTVLILLFVHSLIVFVAYLLFMAELILEVIFLFSFCVWILIITAFVIPSMWYPTLRSFKYVAVLVVILSFSSVILTTIQMIEDKEEPVVQAQIYFLPFIRAIGGVMLAYDVGPTLLNIKVDMKNPAQLKKSIGWSYFVSFIIHVYIAVIGHLYQGVNSPYNVLTGLSMSPVSSASIIIKLISVLGVIYLVIYPIFKIVENSLQIKPTFNMKLVVTRTLIVITLSFLALSFPNFGIIAFLLGGSTLLLLNYVLPLAIYLLLTTKKNEDWPEHKLLWYQVALNIFLITLGVAILIASIIAAAFNISEGTELRKSCLTNFF